MLRAHCFALALLGASEMGLTTPPSPGQMWQIWSRANHQASPPDPLTPHLQLPLPGPCVQPGIKGLLWVHRQCASAHLTGIRHHAVSTFFSFFWTKQDMEQELDTNPVFDEYLRGLWAGRDIAPGIAPGRHFLLPCHRGPWHREQFCTC